MSKKKPAPKKPTPEDGAIKASSDLESTIRRVNAIEAQLAVHAKEIVRLSLEKPKPWWRFW